MNKRNETEILLEMVEKSEENGLISTDEDLLNKIRDGKATDNQYILLLGAVSHILAQLEDDNNTLFDDCNVSTARGEALDNMGRLLNVTRSLAEPALCEVKITRLLNESGSISIPAGTPVVLYEGMASYGSYYLRDPVELSEGENTITAIIRSTDLGYQSSLPATMVARFEGDYPVTVVNEQSGTNGQDIEEDDDYRLRIMEWAGVNKIGTKACIEDYLDHYEGIDEYNLIPLYEGVGTLKIVADTLDSLKDQIANDVYTNCMTITDVKPTVELPQAETIFSIRCTVTPSSTNTLSTDELTGMIAEQTRIFIEGGTTRTGSNIHGVGIGDDLVSSKLIRHILDEFVEVENVYLEYRLTDTVGVEYELFNDVFSVADGKKLQIDEYVVRIDTQ